MPQSVNGAGGKQRGMRQLRHKPKVKSLKPKALRAESQKYGCLLGADGTRGPACCPTALNTALVTSVGQQGPDSPGGRHPEKHDEAETDHSVGRSAFAPGLEHSSDSNHE